MTTVCRETRGGCYQTMYQINLEPITLSREIETYNRKDFPLGFRVFRRVFEPRPGEHAPT